MKNLVALLSSQREVGFLVMRVIGGGTIFWAGWIKMFKSGFGGVTGFFEKVGIPLAEVMGPFIVLCLFP